MTAATTELTPAVRAYLRRATWGLPRERQQEVWDELEEHLLTRAAQLQACGAAPPEALARALAELGSPTRVSAGMTGVYLMPKLILMAGADAVALSAALYALAGGNDGNVITLPVLTNRPITPSCVRGTAPISYNVTIVSRRAGITCYTFNDPKVYEGAYLSLSSIKKAVAAQGGNVTTLSSGTIRLNLTTKSKPNQIDLPSNFTVKGEKYYFAAAIASSFYRNQSNSVKFQGYQPPVIVSDNLKLQFGDSTQPEIGPAFYRGVALELLRYVLHGDAQGSEFSGSIFSIYPADAGVHKLKTTLKTSEVAMLVIRREGQNYDLDVAPVDAAGQITFKSSQKRLAFVSDPDQLSLVYPDGRTPALLVRVTNIPLGNLKSGIFVPAKTTSDAPN
ncbi:permease prefix domain 1-containing protein [Deinococcus frigens]|uniref:permease prefix domain 1-containing protein n=1 Tax=Deinococcus frigens TaxID=249403 RepID=UPI000496D335|nr:permease prefix domain 1-containing protein [Deinococcus frigens]